MLSRLLPEQVTWWLQERHRSHFNYLFFEGGMGSSQSVWIQIWIFAKIQVNPRRVVQALSAVS